MSRRSTAGNQSLWVIECVFSVGRCQAAAKANGVCQPRLECGRSYCTKRGDNAHKIEEFEVLYRWHPWFGRVIHIHEVIDQRSGGVLQCRPDGDASGRWLELPKWMFDRAAWRSVWRPHRVSILRRS
jgi:hypothetical protein